MISQGALIYAVIYLDLLSSFLSPGHMNLFNLKLPTRRLFCLKYIALIAISPARHCFLMMSVQLFRVCFLDHDREGTARFFIASAWEFPLARRQYHQTDERRVTDWPQEVVWWRKTTKHGPTHKALDMWQQCLLVELKGIIHFRPDEVKRDCWSFNP